MGLKDRHLPWPWPDQEHHSRSSLNMLPSPEGQNHMAQKRHSGRHHCMGGITAIRTPVLAELSAKTRVASQGCSAPGLTVMIESLITEANPQPVSTHCNMQK